MGRAQLSHGLLQAGIYAPSAEAGLQLAFCNKGDERGWATNQPL